MVLLPAVLALNGCKEQSKNSISAEACLELASVYYNNGLYQAAVDQYNQYLKDYNPEPARRANTYFTIANIYFERLNDYQKALEYYFKVKYLFPESNLQKEVSKRIVACLERLDRTNDALRVIQNEAALDTAEVAKNRPGQVLAEIGNRKITQGDLEFEIQKLPPALQAQFQSPEKKKELLQQLILQDLLYESAKRQGLDKDRDVIQGVFEAKKALMANKLLEKELSKQVNITPEEVELYYKANKERYVEKDEKGKTIRQKSFAEVREQVARDLLNEKQQKSYQALAQRLMQAEGVKIYEQRIR